MDESTRLIRGLPLMARLPDADLQALAITGSRSRYKSGEYLFRQGDAGDSIHVIVGGGLRVAYTSPSGYEATLALMGPGEACGDLALLDGRPRSADAIAIGTTTTLVITRQSFLDWVSHRPAAARALLETLSLLIRRKDEALADLAFVELSLRLAKQLLSLAETSPDDQRKAEEPGGIRLRITQAELATMLGVTRESVNKELNELARRGWLTLGRGSVTVSDSVALKSFAYGNDD